MVSLPKNQRIAKLAVGIVFLAFSLFGTASRANVTGPDAQNFNATTSGLDFVTVQSADTLDPMVLNLGLFVNNAVNTLPLFSGEERQSRTRINDSLLMLDMNLGLGLFENFEIGFSYPHLLRQKVNSTGPRGQFKSTGNTEVRFMAKYRFYSDDPFAAAFILSTNVNRVENNPYVGENPEPTVNLELAGGTRLGPFSVGANIGYRIKQPGEPIPGSSIQPTDDDYIASAAASYLIEAIDSKLIVEAFGSRPATSDGTDATSRQQSSLEALAGIKHFLNTNLALHAGAGTEMIHGASSPDWRVYAGINWTTAVTQPESVEVEVTENFASKARRVKEIPIKVGEMGINFGNIYFKSGSHTDILPGGEGSLQKLVQYINKPPLFKKLIVEGHTDAIGNDAYNMQLSINRANTVRGVLIKRHGVDASKVEAKGFGETQPIANNGNFQGRQKNRRVVFKVIR